MKLKDIWAIRVRLQIASRTRELALFNLAIDSKLRSCDLVKLRVCDVCHGSVVAARAMVMQQKTQRPVQFEITEQTRESLLMWIRTASRRTDAIAPTCSLSKSIATRNGMSHNNTNRQYDICEIVADWLDDKATDIGWREVKRSFDRGMGKFVAGYEVHNFLISISAWTQGNCLDVDVLDTRTDAVTMHCVGPCQRQAEILARLNSLQERIKPAI